MTGKKQSFLWMRVTFDFSEFTIQCFTVNTKCVGGLVFVFAGLFEDLEDVFFLHFVERQGPLSRVVEHAPIATEGIEGEYLPYLGEIGSDSRLMSLLKIHDEHGRRCGIECFIGKQCGKA